eukprot:CAMPEP_0182449154 /NCGR_PEP_ID=MMETSP1172-20130603/32128_1 /TAXON_ID=708627 /ORGANISM="Timspurckia oligopyrenoides, Strain CCMP3278" /LENGTH=125 /DNA_ID=CAMNT_0024646303 /DNA_START=203 /DNA_END=580 /DNA_ORIENTATION=+
MYVPENPASPEGHGVPPPPQIVQATGPVFEPSLFRCTWNAVKVFSAPSQAAVFSIEKLNAAAITVLGKMLMYKYALLLPICSGVETETSETASSASPLQPDPQKNPPSNDPDHSGTTKVDTAGAH